MKILILTNYANGLYLFRKELLLALQQEGHTIEVSLPPDENMEKIAALGCRIIETPFERRGNNPVKDVMLFCRYLKIIKDSRADVVFTYTIKPNLYGGLACTVHKKPYICNITGLGTALEKEGILSTILLHFYKISVKKARRVFFQNIKNQQFMNERGVACHNASLLPGSGVNLTEHPFREYPVEKNIISFLAVIRIMKDKGIDEYLTAAEEMKQRGANARFFLAGEYEEETREIYEKRIQRLQEENIICYLGHIDNVEQEMAKRHVIVHPSYHEGMSNVLLEAAACGRPVLATNVHGCIETLSPNVSGIVFEPRSAQALIEAMEKLLQLSFQERRQMGIAGRHWVETHFDRRLVISAYEQELDKLQNK